MAEAVDITPGQRVRLFWRNESSWNGTGTIVEVKDTGFTFDPDEGRYKGRPGYFTFRQAHVAPLEEEGDA